MSSTQPINVHRFEGGHHHVVTGDPEELSRQDGADRSYAQLELRLGGKSASFKIYHDGEIVGSFSPPLKYGESHEGESFVAHEVYRVRPDDPTLPGLHVAKFRDHEYHHDPVDIANDSIFESLFTHATQGLYERDYDFKFDDKLERAVRSLSVLRPDRHFIVTRTRVVDGSVKAFRCWMYFQNNRILEEVADLEASDD